MAVSKSYQDKVTIDIDTSEMTPAQIRLIKSLNHMLVHVLKAEEEGEFFDGSAEFMRMCAAIIQQSKFPDTWSSDSIPYADQALEFSVDVLQDFINSSNVVSYDN
ncbi:MAG: hypothetical protein KC493_12385 [Bacteriovoracaceae bacterium]|nr:hypothetical protein [Bacteriovoracaceae bacterium]